MAVVVVSSVLVGEATTRTRHPVHPVVCEDPLDYYRGLAAVWDTADTLVNIEHDVESNDRLIDELVGCPELACARPYLIRHLNKPPFFGCAVGPAKDCGWGPWFVRSRWVDESDVWADFASPGFIKVSPQVRGPLGPECAWQGVELAINEAVDARWHLHWPAVEHFHH